MGAAAAPAAPELLRLGSTRDLEASAQRRLAGEESEAVAGGP
jgi:hypothetical protein